MARSSGYRPAALKALPRKRQPRACGTAEHIGTWYLNTQCECSCHIDHLEPCDVDSRKGA